MLLKAEWPRVIDAHDYDTAPVDAVERLVSAVRGLRTEQGLEPGAKIELEVRALEHADAFAASESIVARLVRAESLKLTENELSGQGAVAVDRSFEAAVRLGEADRQAERQRLEKQKAELEKRLVGLDKQLANENFVTRANPAAVENVRKTAAECRATLASVEERLAAFD
jgi:valyl-tRNA synthetase